jgi:hypothetical protein
MQTLILSLILLLTISCNKEETLSLSKAAATITPTLIGKSSISNPSTPLHNVLISNQAQWDAIITSMNAVNNVSDNFTETSIDFSNFDIIAVFRNPISNSSSTVDIITIDENQTNRVVTVQNLTDGISADVAQPFHIVKIPKSSKPIVFQ